MNCWMRWGRRRSGVKTVQNNTQSMQLMSFSTTSPLNRLDRCFYIASFVSKPERTRGKQNIHVHNFVLLYGVVFHALRFVSMRYVQPEALESHERKNTQYNNNTHTHLQNGNRSTTKMLCLNDTIANYRAT